MNKQVVERAIKAVRNFVQPDIVHKEGTVKLEKTKGGYRLIYGEYETRTGIKYDEFCLVTEKQLHNLISFFQSYEHARKDETQSA